jgi:TPR repeat protein
VLAQHSEKPKESAPPAAQRGMTTESDDDRVKQGHHYVVAIGIDHYESWPTLGTAVSDGTGFAKLLTSQFGFEYAAEPLTEKSATRDNIDSLIDDDLRKRLKPEDDLLIFFAGHGTTRRDKVGDEIQEVGFLVPVEARAPGTDEHWSDYINIEEFLREVSTLPSEHILVILDSCHSGMALGSKFNRSRADTRFERDMLRKVSRKVITSAEGDQLAADSGPLPGHSLFTGLLMQGLTTGKADSFSQGFITATQLGAFAQHEVGIQEGSKQTPLFGSFNLDAGGEMIIPLGTGTGTSSDASPPVHSTTALTRLESIEIARAKKDGRRYWQPDPLKNFPAARSAALKLCDGGDGWACSQAAESLGSGLGGSKDYELAIQLARKGCQSGASEACVKLGDLYWSGVQINRNLQQAVQLYRDACARGDQHGCIDLAGLYLGGPALPQDYVKASGLYRQACEAGEMEGCVDLGLMSAKGEGSAPDASKAAALYRKACDGGEMEGCDYLGTMYESGQGVSKDLAGAALAYRKACDNDDMRGCVFLGYLYSDGKGTGNNNELVGKLFRKACDGNDMFGCRGLSLMYEYGRGVTKDLALAATLAQQACGADSTRVRDPCWEIEAGENWQGATDRETSFFRRECDAGDVQGCLDVVFHLDPTNPFLAYDSDVAGLLLRACNGGAMEGCSELGGRSSVANDFSKAVLYWNKACDGGRGDSCDSLGQLYDAGKDVTHDPALAVSLYQKACAKDYMYGCLNLGAMYEQGDGVAKDINQAFTLFRKACDGGEARACRYLGDHYREGNHVAKDNKEAMSFYRRACDGGSAESCEWVASLLREQ